MNKLDALAYEAAFSSIFNHVKKMHPGFGVGKTLKGIIADWSDTQISGLKGAIGEETANNVLKRCQVLISLIHYYFALTFDFLQVHFQRSVKRVSERANKGGSSKAHKAFTSIAYEIPKAKTKAAVEGLFRVLCGTDPLACAVKILPEVKVLVEYQSEHSPQDWVACSHWCDWWMRKNHLSEYYCQFALGFKNVLQGCSHRATVIWSQQSLRTFQVQLMPWSLTTDLGDLLTG
jgi:hypothetical protein